MTTKRAKSERDDNPGYDTLEKARKFSLENLQMMLVAGEPIHR